MKIKEGGNLITDESTVLKRWRDDFDNLLNQTNSNIEFDDIFLQTANNTRNTIEAEMKNVGYLGNILLNKEIAIDEIEKVVAKLKNNKSVGNDEIPNEVIKCKAFTRVLYLLIKKCFHTSMVPSCWKKAIIKPIPKGSNKDPYVPLNYRGISLISCVAKTYSSLLNNRIVHYCNELDLFADEQNGFRLGRSCEDHIFSLSSIIKGKVNKNTSIYCAFIDLEKAFDWVNRDLLLYNLVSNNIDGKFYFAIKSLLCETLSCVELRYDCRTEYFMNQCGVRQGDPLSPTLFGLYINDLARSLKENGPTIQVGDVNLNALLYADDMVLIAESEADLQSLLDHMYDWCYKWRLSVNRDKTKIVHFRQPRQSKTQYGFHYGLSDIEIVSQYKYLGIIMDEYLKFDQCTTTLSNAGSRALGAIISKFKSLKDVGYNTFKHLYDSGVTPILEYGSGVWGYVKSKEIETVQNRAMRFFLGVHRFAPIAGIIGDMGWTRPFLRRYLCMVRLWNRLLTMDDNRITKKIFLWSLRNEHMWAKEIKNVFEMLDLGICYESMSMCDLNSVKNKIHSLAVGNWEEEIIIKPKLRTYITFKNTFGTESYVTNNISRRRRSLLSQFRIGILPIHVETGRFRNLPVDRRVCEICKNGEVEDEKHFLCECDVYCHFREELYTAASQKCIEFMIIFKISLRYKI